ncbi:MAG: SMC-Scp complex subunit ScpB [Candidatus Omnitrophica bacterium]|nr:SMC-Scp complex subunit ScpB [Candidatus Omnitrophota bacterium]
MTEAGTNQMTDAQAKRILEALLLITDKPLLIEQAKEVFGDQMPPAEIRRLLKELAQEYAQAERGIQIHEVAEGFQMTTDPQLAPYVMKLTRRVRSVRLTKPSLETLAIIAYRQPVTRVEIEHVRGVDAGGVLETLLKFNLVRVAGRKEVVGRPLLYETTREFLDHFGLRSLEDLPTLEDLKGEIPPLPEPSQENPQPAAVATDSEKTDGETRDNDDTQTTS